MAKLKSSKKDNTFKLTDIEVVNVKKTSQVVVMVNPETGEQVEASTVDEAEQLSQMGYMPADTSMEDGGTVLKSPNGVSVTKKGKDNSLSVAEKLTGEYIEQVPTHQLVDARDEVEEDEYLKFPNNEIREAHGERHEEGGINLNLEKGTKILSNNLTIGKSLAKQIEADHGIKVKPDMTYADVLDKYSSKIGLEKLNEEQEELFAMLSKQEKIKDDNTKKVNLDYLNAKIFNIEKKKNTLKIEQDQMFEKLFAKQEESKPQKPEENFRYGGTKGTTELQAIADKHGISLDRAMFLLGGMKKEYAPGGTVEDPMDASRINYLARVAYLDEQEKNDPNKQPRPVRKVSNEPYSVEEAFTPIGIERLNVKLVNLGLQPLPTTATKEQVLAAVSSMQQTGITKFPELVEDYVLNTAKPTNKHGDILSQVNKEKGTKYANTNEDLKKALAAGDITPEQVRAGYGDDKWWYRGLTTTRQKVSPEEYARIQKEREKDFIQSGNAKYLPSDSNPDEYIEYYTDDAAPQPPTPASEVKADINNPRGYENITISDKPLLKTGARGYFFPDQSVLPPNPLEPHLMVTNRRQRIDPVKIGIEDNLTELNRQALTMEAQLDTLPPSQRAAAMASLLTATQQGANTAITGANRTNAQNQQNAELFNIRQADAEDTMRGNNLRQFEALQLTAKAKTDKDLRDYFSYNRRVALNNLRSQQTLNMIEVQSPDYSLDLFGNAVNFDPSYTYKINQGSV